MKLKENDRVLIKSTRLTGVVKKVLPNPYFPSWICSPNYLVMIDGDTFPSVLTKKQIRLINR